MVKYSNLIRYSIAVLGVVGLTMILLVGRSTSNSFAQGNATATNTRTPTLAVTLFNPLVQLTSLPPLTTPSFTPSKTVIPSSTPTFTATPTSSPTLTLTHSPTPTMTLSPTSTASYTPQPSATATIEPSNTPLTTMQTVLPAEVASQTLPPSSTSTLIMETATSIPTDSETVVISETPNNTDTPTASPTPSLTQTATVTQTVTSTSTLTATATLTETPTITPSPTITSTSTLTNTPSPPITESTRPAGDNNDDSGQPISPLLMILGGLLTLAVGGYMVSYAMNAAAVDRYARGFVINRCPVCEIGHLDLEERFNRILLIPRVKRTVRCDNCRSVLREVGKYKWRYAVDPAANPNLYQAMNNRIVHENELFDIAPDHDTGTPEYIDD
jgi:hypothetical protein